VVIKCSSSSRKGSVVSASITLLMELLINYSESKDRVFVEKTTQWLNKGHIVYGQVSFGVCSAEIIHCHQRYEEFV
jgi:hypothetical protein